MPTVSASALRHYGTPTSCGARIVEENANRIEAPEYFLEAFLFDADLSSTVIFRASEAFLGWWIPMALDQFSGDGVVFPMVSFPMACL
jgi:hypothetical protein